MTYYAQYKQDYIINYLLQDKREGVFFDGGAYDGKTISNTYFFESERSWTGICVEPIPKVFEQLKNNRKCHLINGALSPFSGQLAFKRVHGGSEMLSGLAEFRHEQHEKRTQSEVKSNGGSLETIKVKGYTFSKIMEIFDIDTIDYMSLDVEGGELEILESIDFDKFNIKCLTVENNYHDSKMRSFMKSKGYHLWLVYGVDDFYIKNTIIPTPSVFGNRQMILIWIGSLCYYMFGFIKKRLDFLTKA